MSRKTIQVSQELHKDLKLRSAQDGVPIPEVIANLLKEGVTSAGESVKETPRADDGEEEPERTITIPDEFWRQLTDDATGMELVLMRYKPERDDETGMVTFTREASTWTIPGDIGPEITPERAEEATKLIEAYKRQGIDPQVEYTKELLIRWRMLIRAKARVIDLIEELEKGLGKRPLPAQYNKVYNDIQTLENAMKDGDYATLKAKIREADPDWKEWTPPAAVQIAKEWLDKIYSNHS